MVPSSRTGDGAEEQFDSWPRGFARSVTAYAWGDELRSISSSSKHAQDSLHLLHQWLWTHVVANDVLPREMPEPLATLL